MEIRSMEYDRHIFLKDLVFQMKNLVFQIKNLVFRSETLDFDKKPRYFKSKKLEILNLSHIRFEILGISSEIRITSKKM